MTRLLDDLVDLLDYVALAIGLCVIAFLVGFAIPICYAAHMLCKVCDWFIPRTT
jgi:hypothetical protein